MTFCAFDTRCVVYDRQSKIPGLSHGWTLCEGCRTNGESTLNLLRYDYVDLSQLVPKADGRNDEANIFRPKPESSPPVNDQVFNLRADIAYFVRLVTILTRKAIGSPLPRPGIPVREGYALDADVHWLGKHVDDLARVPATVAHYDTDTVAPAVLDGLGMLLRLRAMHRRARVVCGLDARTVTMPGFCPTCNTTSLRREAGDTDKIWCLHCKLQLSSAEYGQVVRLQYPMPVTSEE